MPFDGGLRPFQRPPRDLGAIARAAETGAICPETALVFAEWAITSPPSKPPSPPKPLASRHNPNERALWREEFARWYLWHSSLRPRPALSRSAVQALRAAEAEAEPHISAAKSLLGKLRATDHLKPEDIPVFFDPLAEGRLDAFRRVLERQLNQKKARRRRLCLLDEEGGFFRSLRSIALMRFVQAIHRPPNLLGGWDKARMLPPQWKIDGLDLPYVEANKEYRSVLRVDVDETFESVEDLKQRILDAGVPLPNIVSWFLRDNTEASDAIPRPHLLWLLDRPVWWKHGTKHSQVWRSTLGRLTHALGGMGSDLNGMLNPMRVKNPLGAGSGFAVFDDVPWSLHDLFHALPEEAEAPPVLEPSLLAEDDGSPHGSQDIFRFVATYANARARELKGEPDGQERLAREVLALHEDRQRLRHGSLTPAQVEACRRTAGRMIDFAWTLAHRGRPALPPDAKPERHTGRTVASRMRGHSAGGSKRVENVRKKLQEWLPDAIEACWGNERVPINPARLAKYIDAAPDTLRYHADLVIQICEAKNIPYKASLPEEFERVRATQAARRAQTQEKIEGFETGRLDLPNWYKTKPRKPSSLEPPRERAYAPRRRRRKFPLRVAGLAIGRPLAGNLWLNDLQACMDEIIARAGGVTARMAFNTSTQLVRDLNVRINDLLGKDAPVHPTPLQRLTWEVLKRRWISRSTRPKPLAQAARSFRRVPLHILKRALITPDTTSGRRPSPTREA